MAQSSATSFLTIGTVAEAAGVTRQTIYNWLESGLIEPRYDVEGTAIFSPSERDKVLEIAKERKQLADRLKLPR